MLTRRSAFLSGTALALGSLVPGPLPAQEAPKRGGVFTIHLNSEQRILNPALRASTGVYIVAAKMMEPLVDLNAAGEPEPMLATAWETSPDGKTITFKLRPNVTWHDGKPFTAADVQYTAMEMWKKHLNYGTTLQLYLEAVETPDPLTAVFRYSRPMPLDLLLRALPDLGYIAPKHVFEGTNVLENPANTAPVGTGPFKFVQYERGQFIIAERNPNYWRQGLPYLDRIVWRFITDKAAAAAAIETGQVLMSNYSSLALADLDRLKKDQRFEVSTRGNEGNAVNNTIEFNFRRKELADLRVRQAIAHALDVDFFCENFLYGFGKRGTGPIPTSSPAFYPQNMPQYGYDPKKAEKLLDEAGYPKGRDGTRFSVRLLPAPWARISHSGPPTSSRRWLRSASRWRSCGSMRRAFSPTSTGIGTSILPRAGTSTAAIRRSRPRCGTRSGSPKGAPWTNQWGWRSDDVDKVIDDAQSELDPAKRKALYAEFVRLVNTEIPVWMAIERQFVSVTSQRLKNHHNNPRWPSSHWADAWLAG